MRWFAFKRLRVGSRVVWIPTQQRGVVIEKIDAGDELRVQWESGRVEKLVAAEDAFHVEVDASDFRRAVSTSDLALRRMAENDGSPEELARVWREAAELRAARSQFAEPRPCRVRMTKNAAASAGGTA